jgi:hypothetical protein
MYFVDMAVYCAEITIESNILLLITDYFVTIQYKDTPDVLINLLASQIIATV